MKTTIKVSRLLDILEFLNMGDLVGFGSYALKKKGKLIYVSQMSFSGKVFMLLTFEPKALEGNDDEITIVPALKKFNKIMKKLSGEFITVEYDQKTEELIAKDETKCITSPKDLSAAFRWVPKFLKFTKDEARIPIYIHKDATTKKQEERVMDQIVEVNVAAMKEKLSDIEDIGANFLDVSFTKEQIFVKIQDQMKSEDFLKAGPMYVVKNLDENVFLKVSKTFYDVVSSIKKLESETMTIYMTRVPKDPVVFRCQGKQATTIILLRTA